MESFCVASLETADSHFWWLRRFLFLPRWVRVSAAPRPSAAPALASPVLGLQMRHQVWCTLLSLQFTFPNNIREKAMAPHSSTLAWKIPWTEEPDGLQSMASLRVRHDWGTSLSIFTFMHWRRKWQPTPVFLPGEPQGRGSLVGFCLWGCTESDTTEAT